MVMPLVLTRQKLRLEQQDTSNLTPALYVLISCITYYHIVCAKSSTLLDFVLGARTSMLDNSRRMGLHSLSSNIDGMADRFLLSFETSGTDDPQKRRQISLLPTANGDLTPLWNMWVFREHQKRLAWAIIVSYLPHVH